MKHLYLPLLFICIFCNAQKTFTVQDSLTKEPLPYVAVNLLNGFGVYSDDKGVVTVTDAGITAVELSCLGYKPKKVTLKDINAAVSLQTDAFKLDELVITPGKKAKRKVKEVKPKGHQDSSYLYMSSTALQYAFLVEAKEPDSYLSALALPLIEIAFEAEGRPGVFTAVPFTTLVKIELLQNINGSPGEPLAGFEQLATVSNTASLKRFDVALTEEIPLPANGLFVQLTILGRADANGALSTEPGYDTFTDTDGKTRLWARHCQPNFPLVERPKGALTFIRQPFGNNTWKTINEPHLHSGKKYPDMNIPFGYTLATYP